MEKAGSVGGKTNKLGSASGNAKKAQTNAQASRAAAEMAAAMDATGVLATVVAYSYPKCGKLAR